jgi:hypothetical protein
LVLNYIKDCQSILEEVVSADRTKNNNKKNKKKTPLNAISDAQF